MSQADAEVNFKKKFQEKTKNAWDKHQQFTSVKGKYELQSALVTHSQVSTTEDLHMVQLIVLSFVKDELSDVCENC